MPDYRKNQCVQVTLANGRRVKWRTVVESVRANARGQLVGYVHYEQHQWRVRQITGAEGDEWIGVNEDNKRIDITHWLLDAYFDEQWKREQRRQENNNG